MRSRLVRFKVRLTEVVRVCCVFFPFLFASLTRSHKSGLWDVFAFGSPHIDKVGVHASIQLIFLFVIGLVSLRVVGVFHAVTRLEQ